MRATPRRRTLIGAAVLALAASIPIVATVQADRANAAPAQPGDGTTPTTAGASCWGIKTAYPSSADGTYWLLTGSMDRPAQFWCDQTTAGGGWVLVGRGRETWTFHDVGQGSPATVRTTVDGPGAFAAAALDADTITRLADNAPLTSLTDGIRVERSTKDNGSNRQDLRLFPAYPSWTWAFGSGQRLSKVQIDGTTYANGNTKDTAASFYDYPSSPLQGQQGTKRLLTAATAANSYLVGFGFGSGVNGSTSSTTHLYKTGNGTVLPFSRVWLRPRIANSATTFTPIPAAGHAADPNPPSLKNRTEVAPWGVVGIDHTNEETTTPWYTPANVIKAYGDRVFVGGRFTGVRQGPTGTTVAQRMLAAFDLDGEFIPTFRPTVDGRVWDMTMTTDGKLIIGGDFTSVNGAPNTSGLAALDPATGQLVPGWTANVTRTAGNMIVRALDSRGPWVYAAGRFNRVQGGGSPLTTVSSAINVKATNGQPGGWKPVLTGTAVRIRAAAAGDRVYLAGYFNAINTDPAHGYYGITDATTGVPVAGVGPWRPSIGSNAKYQQAVAESGDRILVGGSEHDFQFYDRNRTTLLDAHITKSGGDTQAIEVFGNDVYLACHCDQWIFSGTNNWTSPAGFRSVAPIMLVGRVDATTMDYDRSWYPSALRGVETDGVWSMSKDSRGCLWVAGDLTRGATSGNAASDWLGGFGRFCPTDSTPPTAPTNLKATVGTDSVSLTWNASTDAGGSVAYDIYRNDRVIATVYGTTYADPVGTGTGGTYRYTVRAADTAGNRSASPAPIAVNGPAPQIASPVPFGSTWAYRADGTDLGTGWRAKAFDTAGWASGKGTFGWGGADITTTVSAAKPVTSYYRTAFTVADASQARSVDLQLKVNSGAVVYVNGVEAGRINMPAGAITGSTASSGYICCTEEARIKTLTFPGSLLTNGSNTVAVELHAWAPGASRALFDLQASVLGTNGDTTAPTKPTLTAGPSAGAVSLSWTPASDDTVLGGYLLRRDGNPFAVVSAQTTTFTDGEVDVSTAHSYVVTAFDINGNATASDARSVAPSANPNLLAYGSTWRWSYTGTAPAGAWTTAGYDDSAWAAGPGQFGFGEPKGTTISVAPAPRPLTSYYRTTVTIADPTAFSKVLIDLIRNSGGAVYVNGVEVGRSNLPAGPLTASTYASTYVGTADRQVPVRFEVPSSAFVAGANVIAVELHLNSRNQATAGFDLKLTGAP
jgi:hypothetical protein